MSRDNTDKKEASNRKRDISSLYARLGLDAGTYREFPVTSPLASSPEPADALVQAETRVRVLSVPESVPPTARNASHSAARPKPWPALRNLDIAGEIAAVPQRKKNAARIAFFSLCGGVGRTTLALNLARLLAAEQRDAVLVNCGNSFALEAYLRPRTPRFDVISFLHGAYGTNQAPVTVIQASAAELAGGANAAHGATFLEQAAENSDFVLYDLPVVLDAAARELLASVDHVVVPLLPDLASAASVSLIDSLLQSRGRQSPQISFLFNRFDETRQLHREIRTRVERVLGTRLLRFTVREDADLQDAAIEGVPFVDQSPESQTAADLASVAEWLASLQRDAMTASAEIVRRGTA